MDVFAYATYLPLSSNASVYSYTWSRDCEYSNAVQYIVSAYSICLRQHNIYLKYEVYCGIIGVFHVNLVSTVLHNIIL
jgi:hypothetical protein